MSEEFSLYNKIKANLKTNNIEDFNEDNQYQIKMEHNNNNLQDSQEITSSSYAVYLTNDQSTQLATNTKKIDLLNDKLDNLQATLDAILSNQNQDQEISIKELNTDESPNAFFYTAREDRETGNNEDDSFEKIQSNKLNEDINLSNKIKIIEKKLEMLSGIPTLPSDNSTIYIPHKTISLELSQREKTLATRLSKVKFPDNPTYNAYKIWKDLVLEILDETASVPPHMTYRALAVCFKPNMIATHWIPAKRVEPEKRISQLFNNLDQTFLTHKQYIKFRSTIRNFKPEGDIHDILSKYETLIPADELITNASYYIQNLNETFSYSIQLLINQKCFGKLPTNYTDYATLLKHILTRPIKSKQLERKVPISYQSNPQANYNKKFSNKKNKNKYQKQPFVQQQNVQQISTQRHNPQPYKEQQQRINTQLKQQPLQNKYPQQITWQPKVNQPNILKNNKNLSGNTKIHNNYNSGNNYKKAVHTVTTKKDKSKDPKKIINLIMSVKQKPLSIMNIQSSPTIKEIPLGILYNCPLIYINIYINNVKYIAVKDNGSQLNIMAKKVADKLKCKLDYDIPKATTLGSDQLTVAETIDEIPFHIRMKEYNKIFAFKSKFMIVDMDQTFEFVLGLPFLAIIEPDTYSLTVQGYKTKAIQKPTFNNNILSTSKINQPIIALVRNTLDYGEDIQHERIQLLSESYISDKMSLKLDSHKNIFTNSFIDLSPSNKHKCHKIIIPRLAIQIQKKILFEFQNTQYTAHPGIYKTFNAISTQYHWVGLYNSVQDYVPSCDNCQRNKDIVGKTQGLLMPLDIPHTPWEVVTLDFVTHLPNTAKKKYADNKRKAIVLHVGEYVLLSTQNLYRVYGRHKFDARFIGPFKICKIINANACSLFLTKHMGVTRTFNISLLKKYVGIPTHCILIDKIISIQIYEQLYNIYCNLHSSHNSLNIDSAKTQVLDKPDIEIEEDLIPQSALKLDSGTEVSISTNPDIHARKDSTTDALDKDVINFYRQLWRRQGQPLTLTRLRWVYNPTTNKQVKKYGLFLNKGTEWLITKKELLKIQRILPNHLRGDPDELLKYTSLQALNKQLIKKMPGSATNNSEDSDSSVYVSIEQKNTLEESSKKILAIMNETKIIHQSPSSSSTIKRLITPYINKQTLSIMNNSSSSSKDLSIKKSTDNTELIDTIVIKVQRLMDKSIDELYQRLTKFINDKTFVNKSNKFPDNYDDDYSIQSKYKKHRNNLIDSD